MNIIQKATIATITVFMIGAYMSCKKFLDVGTPITNTSQENVYENDATAAAVITGIYTKMMNDFTQIGITSISYVQELASDNLILNTQNDQGYLSWWRNQVTSDYANTEGIGDFFSSLYPTIYITNAAIEGIENSKHLTPAIKQRLLGEAYFLRAFHYFYLVNLYGDIPLITSTDYTQTSLKERSPVSLIYEQMISDLQKSSNLLDDTYVDGSIIKKSIERVRPNRSASLALLARVQLYQKKYQDAEKTASLVINQTSLYRLIGVDSVFKKNSLETIWALQPVKQGFNTDEGATFILDKVPGILAPKLSYISNSLLSSFENNDNRYTSWIEKFISGNITYPYAAKYKIDANNDVVSEYCIVLRLAELYLIRAEARLESNNITGALDDINFIRKRAGLLPTPASTVPDIRKAIIKERRVELFCEWGHRWFDIKRSDSMNEIMQAAMTFKGGTWASYKAIYPIPNFEILRDPNLVQNPGY
ncbi:RagB/SusD family nutrient uptake outer membrane protein [Chitinophaga sp. G-6-1-13]|uniref:RagB/SusD family nutrient uptake outer membrane protein n=1 Tax=Chitinophaga fulva TaxID=2728842 RepID=A0A848GYR6_9BACT|nr:RagB/SusD family nutrient uptake outer membrane protein [Chitinophaga fulva]NML40778.1 RagB/SusD family nutrient uptake outer membrane protein [Chitinophaga fulva]